MGFVKIFYLLASPFLAVGALLTVLTIVAFGFLVVAAGLTIIKPVSFLRVDAGSLRVRNPAHNDPPDV